MAREPVKILEISSKDWMGGMSAQRYMSVGGVFRSLTNYDPFERHGVWKPTVAPTERGDGTVAANIKHFTAWINTADSNEAYLYGFANSSAAYAIKSVTPFTVSAITGGITGITTIRGAGNFKGKVLYANDTVVKANSIPVAAPNEATILSGLTAAEHIMHIGPDRNMYITNDNHIARITNEAGTSGNAAQYLTFESDVVTRDITDDGKYLVIAGDTTENLASSQQNGNARCFVAFWNMKSQDLSQIWEFRDSRIYSIERAEDEIFVIGADNIYVCRIDMPIKPLMPLRNNPTIASSIFVSPANTIRRGNGVVLWAMGTSIYGYGRSTPYTAKRLFHLNTGSDTITAMIHDGITLWGSIVSELYDFTNGASFNTSSLILADIDFKRPYEFAYAKIVLRKGLTSGLTLPLEILTQDGAEYVLKSQGFNFTSHGKVSSFIYFPLPLTSDTTSQVPWFEDLTDISMTNNGAEVRRLEVWGYPIPQSKITGRVNP